MGYKEIQGCLRDLIQGITSRSTRDLYKDLSKWVELGVHSAWRRRFIDLFDASELDEVAGDARFQLLRSLSGFRGDDERSLRVFALRVGGRTMGRHAHQRIKEIRALREERLLPREEPSWRQYSESSQLDLGEVLPLTQEDQRFLRRLIETRTQNELARELGISKGRISQIKSRLFRQIRGLDSEQRELVATWLLEGAPLCEAA